jgi:hypothetical protein
MNSLLKIHYLTRGYIGKSATFHVCNAPWDAAITTILAISGASLTPKEGNFQIMSNTWQP